jgi:RHS repeat-associated protein
MAFLHPSTRSSSGNLNSPSPTMMKTAPLSVWITALRRLAAIALLGVAPLAHAQVTLPNGTPDVPVVDLRVKVLGGWVTIDRQWWEGSWRLNQRWDPIQLGGSASGDGGCMAYPTLTVQGRSYVGDGQSWLLENRYSARATEFFAGSDCQANRIRLVRWQDRISGSWMEYERTDASQLQFRLARYGDRNNVTVSLIYNAAGQLSEIRDHFNTPVIRYTYTGGQLTDIRDLPTAADPSPSRIVQYTWGSTTWSGQTIPTITKVTDVLGHATNYGINSGRLETITDPEGRIRRFAYTADRITQYTDGMGYITKYVYDYDKLKKEFSVRITGPGTVAEPGTTTELFYAADGKLNRRDIAGVTTYKRGQVDSRTETREDSAGRKTTVVKDEYDNIVGITYPDGAQKTSKYSPVHGQMTEEVDEIGVKTAYDYDSAGNLTKKTEALGLPEQRVTEYQVDQYGQVTRERHPSATFNLPNNTIYTQPESITQFEYDNYGNRTKTTDALNNVTRSVWNRSGNATQITDALTHVWEQTYDAAGNLKTKKTPLGAITRFNYDKVGNRIETINPLGKSWKVQYNANNRPTKKTNPLNQTEEAQYDQNGFLTEAWKEIGTSTTRSRFDSQGRLLELVDPNGNTLRVSWDGATETTGPTSLEIKGIKKIYVYDIYGRLLEIKERNETLSPNEETSHIYKRDAKGNVIEHIGRRANKTQIKYDALSRETQTIDAILGITNYFWDHNGSVLSILDTQGLKTSYIYDAAGRRIREVRPLGEQSSYEYDALGRQSKLIDPKGSSIAWEYDAAGRRTQETHRLSNQSVVRTLIYAWNDADQLTGYIDSNMGHVGHIAHSASYTLDDLGRRIEETLVYGGATYTQGTTYTATGRKASQRYPDGQVINYVWDSADQLQRIDYPENTSLSITGRWWNLPTGMLYPGGTTETLTWDGFGRQVGQQVKNVGQSVLLQRGIQYDAENNPTRIETEAGVHQYTYDLLNRLTNATHPSGLPTEGFTLDGVGNRLVDITKPNPAQADGKWQYNANHQLLQAATENTSFMGSNSQPINYNWDPAGNLIQKRTPVGTEGQFPTDNQRFVYDAQNRLTEAQDNLGNAITSYQYDPFGRRIRKTVYREWNNGWQALAEPRMHTFLYVEEGLSAEYRQIGSQPIHLHATHGWQPESQWGMSPLWIRTQRSDTQQVERFNHHTDYLGTPLKGTDAQGSVVWSQKATSFGETTVDIASVIENPFRFPGQYYDQETNTHYNFFRDYEPTVGRYTKADPIGLEGGINTYTYVGSNPITRTDNKGLYCPPGDVMCRIAERQAGLQPSDPQPPSCCNWGDIADCVWEGSFITALSCSACILSRGRDCAGCLAGSASTFACFATFCSPKECESNKECSVPAKTKK